MRTYLLLLICLLFFFTNSCVKKSTEPDVLPPIVSTSDLSQLTTSTAQCAGIVHKDGGAIVTMRGVCWSTSQNPIVSNNHTNDGTGTGSFTSNIIGLQANTSYYVRAYAINLAGTSYGSQIRFTVPTPTIIYIPTVTTSVVSNIMHNIATCGGNVTSDGGAIVTARGVCWNTSQNPTTINSHTNDGAGIGSFISNIMGLQANTTYYVRAYAINSVGTSYGLQIYFTTSVEIVAPTVITNGISDISQNIATSGGSVTSNGGATVTVRGVCWSTSQYPTLADNHTYDGSGVGNFTSSITGLSTNTLYYMRAYATNNVGTSYGNEINFTTLPNIVSCGTITDIDGNSYNTVLIGSQCWMRENLKTTKYFNGTAMINGTNAGNIQLDTITKYYFDYSNNPSNTNIYGKLYTWAAVMNSAVSSSANPSGVQGPCPTGWHIPSDAEWTQLTDYLGGNSVVGNKLKEAGTSHWYGPNTGATNSSGFTALPGGNRGSNGIFDAIGFYGYWWTSTKYNFYFVWRIYMGNYESNVTTHFVSPNTGNSVRCVKD